jgi:2-dehydro-3-deoxygalactonokinase
MIGVDWGTTSFRAYRLGEGGAVLDRRSAPAGILQVGERSFADVLRDQVGAWIAAGERDVLLAGMVGSRQGWVEAPYLPCPAGPAELATALTVVPFEGARVRLVPGVSGADASGVPEVMRGEETQIAGVLDAIGAEGMVCLPGSHSKWVRVAQGRIAGYTTHLTGEAFAALAGHTILGRMMQPDAKDDAAFDRGVARSGETGGLLHHLFGVRTLGLMGQLAESGTASYLSGLLIGHEIRAASQGNASVHLIGSAALCALYARAIAALGGTARIEDEEAAARGLARIGRDVVWN